MLPALGDGLICTPDEEDSADLAEENGNPGNQPRPELGLFVECVGEDDEEVVDKHDCEAHEHAH